MILFLSKNEAHASAYASRLRERGVPILSAALDAGERLTDTRTVGGVVVDCRACARAADRLCERLRRAYPALPLLLLREARDACVCEPFQILPLCDEEDAFEAIFDFCILTGMGRQALKAYSLSLDANGSVLYLGYPLGLTGRGGLLLRYLLYRAPMTVDARELLAVCFSEDARNTENLTAQICEINRRAARIDGASPLIECVRGKGYRIRRGLVSTERGF